MRVLEYVDSSRVKPIGGPCGYVYNLSQNFPDKEGSIFFVEKNTSSSASIKKILPNFIVDIARAMKENQYVKTVLKGGETIPDINSFDIIHFHSAFDLESCKLALKDFHGKVVLTIHTPIPPYEEPYNDYNSKISRFFGGKQRMKKYKIACDKALYDCDYLVYPCEEAEESYHAMWEGYSQTRSKIDNKIVYLPTGCVKKIPRLNKDEVRNEQNINNGRFTICYVGRHSVSKGYDSLISLAKMMENDYVQFLICGKEGPLFSPKLQFWNEVGWTKDADSYINASDVFVLPNKSTYFDLVFLEVLSMGKIIVASNTGGNKYFSRFNGSGIFLYNSLEDARKILLKIKDMSQEEIHRIEQKNLEIYEKYFNEISFSKRYFDLYSDIVNNRVIRKTYSEIDENL